MTLALIGYFLLRAAMTFSANEAIGLDGALRRVATHMWGMALIAIVGLGFVAYRIFASGHSAAPAGVAVTVVQG